MSSEFITAGIVEIACPKCGETKSYKKFWQNYCEFGECVSCGKMTYNIILNDPYAPPTITCPYCNSTNTKKISTMSKAGKVALWGVFALGKTSKEWHCNKCKSDF